MTKETPWKNSAHHMTSVLLKVAMGEVEADCAFVQEIIGRKRHTTIGEMLAEASVILPMAMFILAPDRQSARDGMKAYNDLQEALLEVYFDMKDKAGL